MFGHALLTSMRDVRQRRSSTSTDQNSSKRRKAGKAPKYKELEPPRRRRTASLRPPNQQRLNVNSGDMSPGRCSFDERLMRQATTTERRATVSLTAQMSVMSAPMLGKNGKPLKNFANMTTGQVNLIRQSWKVLYASNITKHMQKVMDRVEAKYPQTKDIFYTSAFLCPINSSPQLSRSAGIVQQNSDELPYGNMPIYPMSLSPSASPMNALFSDYDHSIKRLSDLSLSSQRSLLNNERQTKEISQNATFNDHGRLLCNVFENVIINLRDNGTVIQVLRQCGARHAKIKDAGMKADFWERFGEACLEVLQGLDGIQNNKEVCKAWRFLIACMTHEFRTGFEVEVRNILHNTRTASVTQLNHHNSITLQ